MLKIKHIVEGEVIITAVKKSSPIGLIKVHSKCILARFIILPVLVVSFKIHF